MTQYTCFCHEDVKISTFPPILRFPKKWDVRHCVLLNHEITRMRILLNIAIRKAL